MVDLNAKLESTTTNMPPTRIFPKWVMICIQCRFIFKLKGLIMIKISCLQNLTISISPSLLSNTIRFGFILICSKSKAEECRCRVLGKGWVLGIYQPLVGLQDICDIDQNVYVEVFE
jgi:hypothetical protein